MGAARHSLLKRQLRRHAKDAALEGLEPMLEAVDSAYRHFDDDRRMLERSLEISSQELLQTNAELGTVLRLLPDLFIRLSQDGTVLEMHGTDHLLPGWTSDLMIGRRIQDLPDPEAARLFTQALPALPQCDGKTHLDFQVRSKGADRYYDADLFALSNRQVMVFIRDVTQRRQAEGERDRLVTAVEQAAESISITDTRGTILYVNPAFTNITGYSREEAIGQNPRLLKSGKHDDQFYREMWRSLARGLVWRSRFTNRRKDGTTYELESAITPIRGARGQIVNYVLVGRDVTREVELEEQLRQALKMEAIGRLAGGIAHDFNNLLAAILGNAELILTRIGKEDPLREDIQEIKAASARAAELTGQLLAFGRRQVLQPRTMDLNHVLREQASLLRRLLGEPVRMELELAADLSAVRADPIQLEQVIMNLAINARDAMPQGGTLSIRTSNLVMEDALKPPHQLPAGRYVHLIVQDAGVGMDEQVQAHIFEPFFTTKPQGKGTGLGLATVYGIIKQSDGCITVESQPGQGATFHIFLPAVSGAPEPRLGPAPAPEGSEADHKTILLVEDEDQVRRVTRLALERQGYRVLEAAHPSEALSMAEQTSCAITLLLTDVSMPDMNGDLLASRIQALRPGLPVLFMSGHPDASRGLRHMVAGGQRFLKKPFSHADLVSKVREVLEEG
jgi:PAS domain S-box-containing protein